MPDAPIVNILRQGDTSKPNPFTIVIVANPALESPWKSGKFNADAITANQTAFDSCANYIDRCLFGELTEQRERFLADPSITAKIRVVSLFVAGLPAEDATSLVGEWKNTITLVARRTQFAPFLARYNLEADIAYAVSDSTTHRRASAWGATDNDAGPGVSFELDGQTFHHRHYHLIPGAAALHATSDSLTALHEFGHAASSYSNGYVTDLYTDSPAALNNKRARPIPPDFGTYDGTAFAADQTRDHLGYPGNWRSYHCELIDSQFPALMDDYWKASDGAPEHCQHDRITRRFLLDRVRAKVAR
ncbi:MAG: hypothetical protein WCD76_18055 [Pyrinomonadaceae bacterium]